MSLADWDFGLLEELIEARGDIVTHELGIACPCRNGDLYAALIKREGKPANQRRLDCSNCSGDGFIYRNARCIKGLLTGINITKDRRLIEAGFALPGDMTFSPSLSAGIISDLDKITLQYPIDVGDGQVIMRGAAGLEENQLIPTGLEANEDRLWYQAACSIWCEDQLGTVYTQNTDFRFVNKKIVWVGMQPDVGTLYTIKYTAYVEWAVYSTGSNRIDRDRDLGSKVILRKKHVAMLEDSPNNSVETRKQAEIDFTTRTKI